MIYNIGINNELLEFRTGWAGKSGCPKR